MMKTDGVNPTLLPFVVILGLHPRTGLYARKHHRVFPHLPRRICLSPLGRYTQHLVLCWQHESQTLYFWPKVFDGGAKGEN